jgi:hypothetical protein
MYDVARWEEDNVRAGPKEEELRSYHYHFNVKIFYGTMCHRHYHFDDYD